MDRSQILSLTTRDVLHHATLRNADGSPLRVRVNGRCQTWQTRPEDFRLPVVHGLKNYGAITPANSADWYASAAEALAAGV